MPLGPTQSYLAQFNNYQLPGYVQSESFDSIMNIAPHYGVYLDGSPSEELGLQNKILTLTLKVWENDYYTCKEQVELAATYLRSYRGGFASLRVQYTDRHYDAMVRNIRVEKSVPASVRTLDYQIEFECKPWIIADSPWIIYHTGGSTTDDVTRTIDNGGWTPTTVTINTGSSATFSGITSDSQSTGGFVTTGTVSGLVVDTEAFTAKIGATNRNDLMVTKDYRLYVGPGKTTFTVTGASNWAIAWYDRWYI